MKYSLTITLLLLALLACTPASADGGAIYCAKWADASIQGYFGMQLSPPGWPNSAAYAYDINVTNADDFLGACPILNTIGTKYHLHSLWTNSSASSSTLAQCGASYTAGHYDPNFACSGASTWAQTGCASLNRTASQNYTYACTPSNYLNRPGVCEVGDTSNKYGLSGTAALGASGVRLQPSSATPTFPYLLNDTLPPYPTDFFLGGGADLNGWSSVVFHCGDAGAARIFCGKLVVLESWSACSGGALVAGPPTPQGPSSPPAAPAAHEVSVFALIVASIGCLFLGSILTYFVMQRCTRDNSYKTV